MISNVPALRPHWFK